MDEYRKIFALSDRDLHRKIIGVADGPASFNAEMYSLGKSVVSVDPLYVFGAEEIERQFYSAVDNVIEQVKSTAEDWVWSYHLSPDRLKENRVKAIQKFVDDYEKGKAEGRYIVGELPTLGFKGNTFDLAVCSHFLFLYSDQLSYEFHHASILEMLRVSSEVRIFPLLTLMSKVSPHVRPIIEELRKEAFSVSVVKVGYELQRGGNEMLRIQKKA